MFTIKFEILKTDTANTANTSEHFQHLPQHKPKVIQENENMKQSPRPKHKKLNIVPLFIILAAAFILCDIAVSKYHLTITEYERTSPKIDTAIRIVHLTDLHNNELGKENERLVRAVEGADPDLVCITGDLLDLHSSDTDTAINLVEDLAENFRYISHMEITRCNILIWIRQSCAGCWKRLAQWFWILTMKILH